MGTLSIDRPGALYALAHVENALIDGHPPPGQTSIGSHKKNAIRKAAEELGVEPNIVRGWLGLRGGKDGAIKRLTGLEADWTLYREGERHSSIPRESAQQVLDTFTACGSKNETARRLKISEKTVNKRLERAAELGLAPSSDSQSQPAQPQSDPIDVRRLKDDNRRLRDALMSAERRAAHAEDIRAGVLGLLDMPQQPVTFAAPAKGASSAETAVFVLSDLHWSETVKLAAMDGINSYNLEIARARLGRWAHTARDLLTKHWTGTAPARVIIILGGDLISGGIHPDLAKTDALASLPSVRDVAEHLRAAILIIKDAVACRVDVISLPGNHSRSTLKPEAKDVADTSYDVLVSDFLEMGLKGQTGIGFFAPSSPDALFSVYGWRVLASHGDRIGSRGGHGFIGPAAAAARGLKRMFADYAARGVHVDLIVICHFHTPLQLEEGLVNGSLPGPTEFSRDGRFRPHPAKQLFFTMHPRRMLPQIRWIEVGHPSEGSLYEPPPPDRMLRPRFRVRALSGKAG